MLRLVLIELGLFLLPFAVWWGLARLRRAPVVEGAEAVVETVPAMRLATIGAVLVGLSLVGLSLFHQGSAEGTYVPDRFENGRLVPGYIK